MKTPAELAHDDKQFIATWKEEGWEACWGRKDGMRMLRIMDARGEDIPAELAAAILKALESKKLGRPVIKEYRTLDESRRTAQADRETIQKKIQGLSNPATDPKERLSILRKMPCYARLLEEAYRGERQAGLNSKEAYDAVGAVSMITAGSAKVRCVRLHRKECARFRALDLRMLKNTGHLTPALQRALWS